MARYVWLAALIAFCAGPRAAWADPCTAPSFGPTLGHTLADLPHGVAVGDFNHDGRADLAVGLYWEVQLAILLGNGSGGFTPAGTISFGDGFALSAVVAADFDRDGHLDLAVTEGAAGSVAVVRGTGTGSFSAPTYHPSGLLASSLAAGDFNRDGRTDLVAAGQDGAYMLLGDGTGGFRPPVTYPAGIFLRNIIAADLNRDGKMDVITVSTDVPINPPPPPSALHVLLGDGNGGLALLASHDLGPEEWGVAAADLDRDGILDLAATHRTGLAFLRGLGNGTFAPATQLYTGAVGRSVQAVDVDGSGTLDLVLSGHFQTHVLLGSGTGSFGPATTFPMGNYDGFLAMGDLNGDQRPDLIVEGEQNVDVRLNASGASCPRPAFDPLYQSLPVGHYPIWLTQGELNRDGRADLIATNAMPAQVHILHGDGAGGFVPAATIVAGPYPTGAAIADFNRDGLPDVAVSSESTNDITLLLGAPGGGFDLSPRFAGGESYGVVAEDFNRDGRIDLAITDVLEDELRVLLGDGQGGFGAPQILAVTAPWRPFAADLNQDGRTDLALVNNADAVTLLFGDGNGGFPTRTTLSVPGAPRAIAIADFNRDGRLDLAVQAYDSPVRVFFGDGSGAFPASVTVPAGPSSGGLVALDYNGDGALDLAVSQGSGTAPAMLVKGNGDGTFGAAEPVGTSGSAARLVAGQFDGDGKIDLALLDFNQDQVVIYHNARCTPRQLAMAVEPSSCNIPGAPFTIQPVVDVRDAGGNPVACAPSPVSARLLPSSPPGTLQGTLQVPVQQGRAAFTDLAVDLPGRRFQLGFDLGTLSVPSRTFSQAITVDIEGPGRVCPGFQATYATAGGYDSYHWTLNGTTLSESPTAMLPALGAGSYALGVTVAQDTCMATDLLALTVGPSIAVVSGDRAMCSVSATTIQAALEGVPPWSVTWSDGITQTGIPASPVVRTVRPTQTTTYTVTAVSDAGCTGTSSGSATVTVDPVCSARYFAVTPCRLADTRGPGGPTGGPALGANTSRAFPIAGRCGIPATAKAVAVNLTAVNPGDRGDLRLYPTGTPVPAASALNFAASRTRANNAVIALGADGQLTIRCDMPAGSGAATHLVLDVFGYLE